MPGCNQTLTGIAKDCAASIGGIKRLFLNLASAISSIAVDVTSNMINDIDLVMTTGTNPEPVSKFKEFKLPKGVGSLQSSLQVNQDNGVNYIQNILTLVFNRMDTDKRMAISALAVSECVAIVEDNNGKYWYVGKDDPLVSTGGDSGTGAAKTDRNGYGINLQSEEKTYPFEIAVGDGTGGTIDLSTIVDE